MQGDTVTNRHKYAFVARTKTGVCNLVKWCSAQGLRLRCSGYRHTFSSMFGEDGQVLLSMLKLSDSTDKTVFMPPKREPASNELHVRGNTVPFTHCFSCDWRKRMAALCNKYRARAPRSLAWLSPGGGRCVCGGG